MYVCRQAKLSKDSKVYSYHFWSETPFPFGSTISNVSRVAEGFLLVLTAVVRLVLSGLFEKGVVVWIYRIFMRCLVPSCLLLSLSFWGIVQKIWKHFLTTYLFFMVFVWSGSDRVFITLSKLWFKFSQSYDLCWFVLQNTKQKSWTPTDKSRRRAVKNSDKFFATENFVE